ncbi:hypothetical protein A4A49_53214 [Nicotiana attenuata]|uniref:CCHC-type domain-containing protein n=1 Tax=Nicotiana attenuata TaxID=49451 RepID=A0A1J6ITC7_NICAT|nr:hypothetical protein A4A49_53214 [Nicotiana attenuata]
MNYKRWSMKMMYQLTIAKVYYVLTCSYPQDGKVDGQLSDSQQKWLEDDFVCRSMILNAMSNALFNVFHKCYPAYELWAAISRRNKTSDYNKRFDSKNGISKKNRGPCFVCGKIGHLARVCKFRKGKKGKKEEANVMEQEEEMAVVLTEILMMDSNEEWWLDFGATCHVTPFKSGFKTYEDVKDADVLDLEKDLSNEVETNVQTRDDVASTSLPVPVRYSFPGTHANTISPEPTEMLADPLTKPLSGEKIEKVMGNMGLSPF